MTDRPSSALRFEAILAEMVAEAPLERISRWQGLFDRLAGPLANHLVLFGAGQFGAWVLDRLRKAGVEPYCFSDNRPELWGTRLLGIEVLSPGDAVARFGQTACFVVTIYNGSGTRAQLRESGCRCVLAAPLLFWKYPDHFMPDLGIDSPDRIVEELEQIRRCFALLSDEASRDELNNQLRWRYWMKHESLCLPEAQGELYFPDDLVTSNKQEVIVDAGAFDGDTLRTLIRRGKGFQYVYALEPDSANVVALRASLRDLPPEIQARVTVWPYALGDINGKVSFVETHSVGSKVSLNHEGVELDLRRLDSLPWQQQPTYIKMDIEGSELVALSGGSELLKSAMPVLAICIYHRTQHLWQVPNLIHSLAPGYSLYLRRYAEDCWEQVCYAVPPHRAVKVTGVNND